MRGARCCRRWKWKDSRWEASLNLPAKEVDEEISEEGQPNGRAQLCRWSRCAFSSFPSSSARARGPSKTSPPNCFSFARDYIYLERVHKAMLKVYIHVRSMLCLWIIYCWFCYWIIGFWRVSRIGICEEQLRIVPLSFTPAPYSKFVTGSSREGTYVSLNLRDGLVKAIKRCTKAWEGRGRWGTGERIGKWLLELDGRIVWGKKLFEVLRDVEGWLLLELPRRNPVGSHTTPWTCGDLDVLAVRRDICVNYRLTFECSWL